MEKSEEKTFGDFGSCPCILILVGKGRMGDTLPESLCALDLRCRYPREPPHQSTLFQDIGRACGYRNQRCLVLLSPTAYKYDHKKYDQYVSKKLSDDNEASDDEADGMTSNFQPTSNNMWSDTEKALLRNRLIMLAAQPQVKIEVTLIFR